MQKLNEQNHKLVSMLALVSTMAEELNGIRGFLGNTNTNISSTYDGGTTTTNNRPFSNLIPVSDNDSDSGDDSDSVSDSDSDCDDSVSECVDDDSVKNVDNSNDNVKIVNMNNIGIAEDIDLNVIQFDDNDDDTDNEEMDDDLSSSDEDSETKQIVNTIDSIQFIDTDTTSDKPLLEEIETDVNRIEEDNGPKEKEIEQPAAISTDFLKTIHIGDDLDKEKVEDKQEHENFRKMTIQKLRQVVQEKELCVDAQKLKKPELLKLLGVNE
jgi:hypothetical protein